MRKCVINGVYFVSIYFNADGLKNRARIYRYIKDIVSKNKRVVCTGDFNGDTKVSHPKIMEQLGFSRVNSEPTYTVLPKARGGNPSYHFNDQVWVLNVDASMVKQVRSDLFNYDKNALYDADVTHESPHDMIIFQIDNFRSTR